MLLSEPVSERSRIVPKPGVEAVQTANGWELVVDDTDEHIALSAGAAQLWQLLDGERTMGEIADAIDQPLVDVIELTRRLRTSGLAGDGPPASPDAPSPGATTAAT